MALMSTGGNGLKEVRFVLDDRYGQIGLTDDPDTGDFSAVISPSNLKRLEAILVRRHALIPRHGNHRCIRDEE